MSLTLTDFLESVLHARTHFVKHLNGLTPEQWNWKPYPGCKSVRETLLHMVATDRMALSVLETGVEPDYFTFVEGAEAELANTSNEQLELLLVEGNDRLRTAYQHKYHDAPLDTPVPLFGHPQKLTLAVIHLNSEYFYHAGQVAFIRMATDPAWDYYNSIYSG